MHIEISYLLLSSKENVIIFYFEATAEQTYFILDNLIKDNQL